MGNPPGELPGWTRPRTQWSGQNPTGICQLCSITPPVGGQASHPTQSSLLLEAGIYLALIRCQVPRMNQLAESSQQDLR